MTETNDAVLDMVEKELQRKPDTSTTDLFELAKVVDPSVKEMTIRQFHARYPLQIKRQQSLSEGGGRRRRSSASSKRRKRSGASQTSTRTRRERSEATSPSGSSSPSGRSTTSTGSAAAIQSVLIAFARDIAKAHDGGPGAVLDVVANLDTWVKKIESAR